MWARDTAWFDLSVILAVFAVGNIVFGRFEQHVPRSRRLLKMLLLTAIYLALAVGPGRVWALAMLVAGGVAAAVIHLWWLPAHGVDGWTTEPYNRYLDLVAGSRGQRGPGRREQDPSSRA